MDMSTETKLLIRGALVAIDAIREERLESTDLEGIYDALTTWSATWDGWFWREYWDRRQAARRAGDWSREDLSFSQFLIQHLVAAQPIRTGDFPTVDSSANAPSRSARPGRGRRRAVKSED